MNFNATKIKKPYHVIAKNKRAFHDYIIESNLEAGIALKGWEVKSLRQGRLQLVESYVCIQKHEAWLFNAFITPLVSASTHTKPNPSSIRKLLLKRREINLLNGKLNRKNYTSVPLSIYWKGSRIKVEISIAKSKNQYDKRQAKKKQEWKYEQSRLFKNIVFKN